MIRGLHRAASTLLVCWLLALFAPARDLGNFSGVVVGVSDGDTICVLAAGREVKVRLAAVDDSLSTGPDLLANTAAHNPVPDRGMQHTVRYRTHGDAGAWAAAPDWALVRLW